MKPSLSTLPKLDFAARREQFLQKLDGGIAVFRAPALATRAGDVDHRYRPDANFHYLTGFDEADAVAVLDGSASEERFLLFVQPHDPERETWVGPCAGVEGACEDFGADAAFPMSELEERLVPRIANGGALHYKLGHDETFNHLMIELARRSWATRPRSANDLPTALLDPGPLVHEMRIKKSDAELQWLQASIDIAAEAHIAALRETKPDQSEFEIEALIEYHFRRNGASGWAYPSIVAGGANATVLHYIANQDRLAHDELLLIDAGCEVGLYCADITRTFPVGSTFTSAQKAVYEVVLAAQEAACEEVKPGSTVDSVHERAVDVLFDGLCSLGLLDKTASKSAPQGDFKKFYMHRTSHWLGLDVHDVGAYNVDGEPRPLEPGMVLTIEPGLYFSRHLANVPAEYLGIGIRIEDDVLVTDTGHRNLSAAVPKKVDDILELRANA